MAADKETRELEILLNAQQANASIKDMAAGVALMNNQLSKMSQDDPRRQQLQRDFQVLTQRVGAARAEMRTYVQTEEEMREATEKLNRENTQVILNGQKLNSSYKEMKASAALLEQQLHEMNGDAPGRAKMLADYHALQDRIAGVSSEMKGATAGTGFLKQGFANAFSFFLGGGILDVVQKIFGFFASAREEFQGSAKSSADLEATLHATKKAAGLTADEIRRIGEERAKVTLFDDDETNRASAMLLTFKNVKKGVFEEAIPAIQDLATKMAGDGPADMKGASIQLGKALNDPIKGITALTRVGVTFTEQQKDQIAAMVKAGNTAGAQKLILAELNSEFGGAAVAARQAAGGMATWTMRWNEIKETVGGFVNDGLTKLFDWLGRVFDKSQPVVDIFVALGEEVVSLWHDVSDLVDGLGLFGEKGDSAAFVANLLKSAITLLVAPLRIGVAVIRSMVDGFIDLYNKSELVRGVLGGLAAMIVSVFTTIKDDALKILGGVGDILIGIFTLDKGKIVAGFKSAMQATADVALESGQRAAEAFAKGYEANKNNRIVRTARTSTADTNSSGGGGTAASSGEEEPAGESAKDKKARESAEKKAKAERDKADRERLADMKAWIKQEGNLLEYRNALRAQLDRTGMSDEQLRREEERQRIFDAADKKVAALDETEANYTEQVAAIVAERDLRLRELWEKNAADEEKRRQDAIDQQIAQAKADAEVSLAEAELSMANGLITEQAYQDAIFAIKQAAMQRELDLIKQRDQQESVAWKKLHADKISGEADYAKKSKAEADGIVVFKKKLAAIDKALNDDSVKFLEDALEEQTVLYKVFKAARKAEAIANVFVNLQEEIQNYWLDAAKMGPVAGPIYGIAMSGLATLRGGLAVGKIAGFAKGGATGAGVTAPASTSSSMWEMIGLRVGGNGKLMDQSGHSVAGVVHDNEYVIPKWMREDPEVMQVEGWLEQRRQRGFYDGGPTTEPAGPKPGDDEEQVVSGANGQRLTSVLESLDRRLAGVEQWATQLEVVADPFILNRDLEKAKKLQSKSDIRPKGPSN
ncbi:hypothetical protein MUN81_10535 [Hymenobacter sp. 5317J-9]|uniref:hypothetical protein n=1 Tax=Hymenobacter sp. 5317J-9 TaxID=2932250 RepID=UPI001FD6331C|nr:hypothetical protein [Hymenobacter sp. 5317J-9]UOQ99916.1 hypothetical protein MUN81_10535 [Hymenobacter sp. 5317J-9]